MDLALYYAFPLNSYHSCIATILGKLYSNSLLVVFNSRIRISSGRDWTSETQEIDVSLHDHARRSSIRAPIRFARTPRSPTATSFPGGIYVEEEVWTDRVGIPLVNQVSSEHITRLVLCSCSIPCAPTGIGQRQEGSETSR